MPSCWPGFDSRRSVHGGRCIIGSAPVCGIGSPGSIPGVRPINQIHLPYLSKNQGTIYQKLIYIQRQMPYTLKPSFNANCFKCSEVVVVKFCPPRQDYSNKNN